MILRTQFLSLFAYHFQISARLLTAASALAAAPLKEALHAKMEHVLRTDAGYRLAMLTGERPQRSLAADFPDIATLQAGFEAEKEAWASFLTGLSDAELAGDVAVKTPGGLMETPCWRLLQQVVLHGMQHHAECALMLTEDGQSLGDIDFIFFREG